LQQLSSHVTRQLDDSKYVLVDVGALSAPIKEQFCKLFGQVVCGSEAWLSDYQLGGEPAGACLAGLAQRAPFSTVLAVDNFHQLLTASQLEFLVTCRSFYTEAHEEPSYRKVLVIVGGCFDLHACEPEETSPFNIADKLYPTDFDFSAKEVKSYLDQWSPSSNLYFSRIGENYVYEITRGQVYFLQRICDQLAKRPDGDKLVELSVDDVDLAVCKVLEERDWYLDGLLAGIRELEPEVKVVLSEVLSGKLHKFSRSDRCIRQLELLGVLAKGVPFAAVRNPLIESFVRDNCGSSLSPRVAPASVLLPRVLGGNSHAYQILFELENEIRNFIVSSLFVKYGARWSDHLPQSEGWKRAKGRHADHCKDGWKGQVGYPLLAYAQFDDLQQTIEQNWEIFGDQFHPRDKLGNYFDRLERIRNDVAHNRRLSHRDLSDLESIRDAFASCMEVR